MHRPPSISLLALLLASALAACSGKPDAPPAAAPAPAPVAQPAAPPAASTPAPPAAAGQAAPVTTASTASAIARRAALDCEDRTIVLEATCTAADEDAIMLDCSEQSLTVLDRASGAVRATHRFDNQPAAEGEPPLVEARVGELRCVAAEGKERYFVADLFNGGNCEACEWHELYDWDGKLVGSDRDRSRPDATLTALVRDSDKPGRTLAQDELAAFYRVHPGK